MTTYSRSVSVNGYVTNNCTPAEPMVHLSGFHGSDHASMTFTPTDARIVALKMIEFADEVDRRTEARRIALDNKMSWKLGR